MDRRTFLLASASLPLATSVAETAPQISRKLPTPSVHYIKGLDMLRLLNEDCSYREEYVSTKMSILHHPYEQRGVGIELRDAHWYVTKHLRGPIQDDNMSSLLLLAFNEDPENLIAAYLEAISIVGDTRIPKDVLFSVTALNQRSTDSAPH